MTAQPPFDTELVALLPRLRRFAHALCQNGTDADDLAQATVERALRSRAQWQPGTRLDSWLYRIMRNLWIDTVRSRGRREKFEAPEDAAEQVAEDPRDAIEAQLELNRMMAAMQRLPPGMRQIFVLHDIEGYKHDEIAAMLGIAQGTSKSQLHRVRMVLRKYLDA